MRPRFEKDIRTFGEVAKEELKLEDDPSEELDNLSKVLSRHLEKAAERQHTNIETQREIFDIQKRKQEIMQRLKRQLACLDDPGCQIEKKENERETQFDDTTNSFRYADDNGKERAATFGELVTDMDWGVNYSLDKKSVSRQLIKKYLVERAKQELREFLDQQIIKSEVGGDLAHEARQKAYKAVEEERRSGVAKERWGFVSESIVKNFLKKLSLDKNLPFEIREGDIFQDVEQKIDFIIHRKEKLRGVNVETSEKAQDVGIQFSVSFQAAGKKKYQIERSKKQLREQGEHIQDVALVIFPLTIANTLKETWKKEGRIAGGPDKFLRRNVAKKLFSKLLKDIFSEEEIENAWKMAQDSFSE